MTVLPVTPDLYCDDGGDNTTGASWATAYTTLATALSNASAGNIIAVGSDHDEVTGGGASVTWTSPGTADDPVIVISMNRTTDVYEKATAPQIGADPSSTSYDLTIASGDIHFIGCWLTWGDDFNQQDDAFIFEDGRIEFPNGLANWRVQHGGYSGYIELIDTDIEFNNTVNDIRDYLNESIRFTWRGGSFIGTSPTNGLFEFSAAKDVVMVTIEDVDLSPITSKIINGVANAINCFNLLKRCKLGSGVDIFNFTNQLQDSRNQFNIAHSCDTGDGLYFFTEEYLEGVITQATNCYLNATYDGTNGYSAKMVSNAVADEFFRPLRFKLSEFWSAANPTLTVEMITDGVTLQNDEFWIEIEYPDATDEALGKRDVSSRVADPRTSPANLTTSTASWTEDLASETKQKIEETISGGAEGIHTVWVCLAKPSTTVYIDPKVMIS